MKELSKDCATWHKVGEEGDGQRVDNYLVRLLKGVPKTHIYRIVRSGEVRVNSSRVRPDHRLAEGDRLRLPPLRTPAAAHGPAAPQNAAPKWPSHILHEDEALIAIDKPAGVAVHGGSGVSLGVIEQLRRERPDARFLELVHRLDRGTSGVLLLAKKRSALTGLHEQLREGTVRKCYLALVKGSWQRPKTSIAVPLHKYVQKTGERRVRVDQAGQSAQTIVRVVGAYGDLTLVEAELKTGRTHQIRVHLAHVGHPIAGDDKYGDFDLNKALARKGLKRMFLHALTVSFTHPISGSRVTFEAPLPAELRAFLESHGKVAAQAV
jgi:23S rRNA pseudouridine955/2504/2580 synthase